MTHTTANTMKVDIDMEEVRLVLNQDYIAMKADAEKEILYRCKMSAGSAVWTAKKYYVPPPGLTVWRTGYVRVHMYVSLCVCVRVLTDGELT